MIHLWFDPGETTGWALFEDERPTNMGELATPDEHWTFINSVGYDHHLDLIGYENYRIQPRGMKQGWTPTWSEVWPIQVIGALRFRAWNMHIPITVQETSVKPAGYGYAGLGVYNPAKKGMHMQDAIAHGAFYYMEEYCAAKRQSQNSQSRGVQRPSSSRVARPNNRSRAPRR